MSEPNLCETCRWDFVTCTSNPTFGCDDGGTPTDDNVTKCNSYLSPQKGWKCGVCGFDGEENQQYNQFCAKCRRHR
jgi:hypothetical protein